MASSIIEIDEIIEKKLKAKSKELGIPASELLNQYVIKGLNENKTSDKKSFKDILKHDNPEGNKNIMAMAGRFKTDMHVNPVDVKKGKVKLKFK